MWSKIAQHAVEWVAEGRVGRVTGTVVGVVLGIVYLIWGFWDMLAFGVIVFAGFTLGLKSDNREKWLDIREVARWLMQKWNR